VEIEELREALYEIVEEHYPITVRGAFYQATARGVIPKTETEGYRPVQRELLKMRREGVIPWGWITDGSRTVFGQRRYGSLDSYAQQVASNYRKDYWHGSEEYVEIWMEKDALRGVIAPVVIGEFGLDLFVSKGQSSATYLYEAADDIIRDGRPTHVYVLSDFDPGGFRIFDRIDRELKDFVGDEVELCIERIAVTPEQIEKYQLPTRPVKEKDPQRAKFEREHGTGCVELDAMTPEVLRSLIRGRLESHMTPDQLQALKLAEHEERDGLRGIQDLLGGAA
jgi:ribosomal protein S10